MKTLPMIAKGLLASLMLFAGVMHFVNAGFFLKIMPPQIPLPLEMVYLSGLCEIVFGIMLLIPRFARLAGWGIAALLIAVFPANIYLYQHQDIVPAPPLVHLFRPILQPFLIWWAYSYTRRSKKDAV